MKINVLLGGLMLLSALAPDCLAQAPTVSSDDIGQMNPEATALAFPGRGFLRPSAGKLRGTD